MATRTEKIWGRELTFEVEVRETPVFTFLCPRCEAVVWKGAVNFDPETELACIECGWEDELWLFPHTLDGKLFSVGGHHINEPMTTMSVEAVLKYFLWCERPEDEFILVHGAEPHVLGTFEECVEEMRRHGYDL